MNILPTYEAAVERVKNGHTAFYRESGIIIKIEAVASETLSSSGESTPPPPLDSHKYQDDLIYGLLHFTCMFWGK